MLNNEEIVLKRLKKTLDVLKGKNDITHIDFRIRDMLEDCIRVIKKQSKEIEELKEKNEYLPNWVSKKYISKDKIKAKIEEYKKQVEKDRKEIKESVLRSVVISDKEERIQELQSLLEKE